MTRPSNFIPETEITIAPNSLVNYMNELVIEIINDVLPYNINISSKNIKKSFKNKIQKSRIWQGILNNDRCMYIYTENSKKCFTLCNRRILRDTNIDDPINEKDNKYFCSNHIKGLDISTRKRRFKDPNIIYCCKLNKNDNPCGNTAILCGNICKEHWKKENGYKKHDKVSIPERLYIKNNSFDFLSNSWYEYRKYIEDHDNYLTFIENKKDGYYEKIISNFNKSENLFLKYLNPGHLARNRKEEDILDYKKEKGYIDIPNTLNNIEKKRKIYEVISSSNIQNSKNISNYYLNNRFKLRKINCEKENNFLISNFSFKYSITDYYIDYINKNNRNLLNKILIYIIDIRNLLHINKYIDKDTYKNIITISDKILEII